MKIFRLI